MENFKNEFNMDGRTFAALVRHAEKCGVVLENSSTGRFTISKGGYTASVMVIHTSYILWNAYTKEKNIDATMADIKKHMSSLSWE